MFLKKKFYKACFVVSGLICMTVASGMRLTATDTAAKEEAVTKPGIHHFDSSGLCTCIPFTDTEDVADAPRIHLNKNAAAFVTGYNKKNGFFIDKNKTRITPYFTLIDSVLEQYDLPVELKYLAYVESGLKPNTHTRSGATGPWALMPAAAKQYGLKVSGQKDERLDYIKSTHAAAKLLTDLYNEYGDWLLVVAAYNCGPGNISKAIKRSGSRNYWALQNFLPVETRSHVKRFIAIHYHFEGHGSLVTMSKAETEAHIKAVAAFCEKKQENEKMDSASTAALKS